MAADEVLNSLIASATRRRRDMKIQLRLGARASVIFPFLTGISFSGPKKKKIEKKKKNQNCQFKLKFGTFTNSNMQNSMVLLILSILDRKHPFLGKFGPKNQTC